MDIFELKQQILSAIDDSTLHDVLPEFCDRIKKKLEVMQVSESDREHLDLLLDFFQNSNQWLNRIAEHPSTKAIEEFLES